MQCSYCKAELDAHGNCPMYQSFADEHIVFWLERVMQPDAKLTRIVALPPPPTATVAARVPFESVRGILPRVINLIGARAQSQRVTRRPIKVDRIGVTCSLCGSQFPDGDDTCGQGHRVGDIFAYVCSACNTRFSPFTHRCACGLSLHEVPLAGGSESGG